MYKNSIFLILVLFCIPIYIQAQGDDKGKKKIDSLKVALKNSSESNKSKIYNELATNYGLSSLDTAFIFAEKALESARKFDQLKEEYAALNTIGTVHFYKGDMDKALDIWQKDLEVSKKLQDKKEEAASYNRVGVIYKTIGSYDKAIDHYQKSADIYKELNDKNNLARTFANIGNIYYHFGENFDKAYKFYSDALNISYEIKDKYLILNMHNSIGNCNYERKELNEAIDNFRNALTISKELKYEQGEATSLNNLGRVYAEKLQYTIALKYCEESSQIWVKLGNMKENASALRDIGFVYLKWGRYPQALQYYTQSYEIVKKLGLIKEIVDFQKDISNVYEKMGDYKNALSFYRSSASLKDSIFNADTQKQLNEFEAKFGKKELEANNLKKDKELLRQTNLRNIVSLVAISILILVFVVYNRYRVKQKANLKLAAQNEQIILANAEIERKNTELEEKNDILFKTKKEITDSIQYASRIQTAILPPKEHFDSFFQNYFILYKPRDIVSGDFYYLVHKGNKAIMAAADCTGHGVPGAFMSMLGSALLNGIINNMEEIHANLILNQLRENIKKSLRQTGKEGEAKDGMDIALVVYDKEIKTLEYAGAFNSLLMIRNGELIEHKADKMPIGIFVKEKESFTNNIVELQKDDNFYLFSDGYVSQFGGENGRKFMHANFKKLLVEIASKSMAEQKKILDDALTSWQGEFSQVDDILVMGFKETE